MSKCHIVGNLMQWLNYVFCQEPEPVYSYSVITVESCPAFSWIHHRMPVRLKVKSRIQHAIKQNYEHKIVIIFLSNSINICFGFFKRTVSFLVPIMYVLVDN